MTTGKTPPTPQLKMEMRELDDSSVCVALEGWLCYETASSLFDKLSHWFADKTTGSLTLEFEGVEFIDSRGIETLWRLRERLVDRGIRLKISNPSAHVRRVFDTMRLDRIIEIA